MPTYNKLVRDLIPNIIEQSGKGYKIEVLSEKEYINELQKKLQEEVDEYREAIEGQDAIEELADILELMKALAEKHGSSIDEVEKVRKEKAEKRGAFNNKVFLVEVED
ncbi:nucleoside triphosphate pyrophosphohydrolase [Pontibacillus marinus]|uniref:Phosphoribosyl-ATP pyrophosphohydrolase n=1 Tax=Pontibacillus marinus BH030004 = DSM 16465 TaxID=1385511 RepID=A0A0A5GES2_9BACI|nr:nucleoside triphosphate pyrophosphohydrolase [Pontibacillus marinus]KGX91721.1 phosphoribosyl-ATP pyrophosphohydrolase [Pontibacillus marinus BH030004 = DSM 16465]